LLRNIKRIGFDVRGVHQNREEEKNSLEFFDRIRGVHQNREEEKNSLEFFDQIHGVH